MNVTFETKKISGAIKSAKRIFEKSLLAEKGSGQDCLVASKEDGSVTIESAANGLYTKFRVEAHVEDAGKVVVPRDNFAQLRLKGSNTVLKYKDGADAMGFKSGSFKGNLAVNQDFSALDAGKPQDIPPLSFTCPAEALKKGVRYLIFAPTADQDNTSEVLPLQISIQGNVLRMMTNDGFRAGMFRVNLSDEYEHEQFILVPGQFFANVVACIEDEDVVSFGANDHVVRVQASGIDVCHPILQEAFTLDVEQHVAESEKEKTAMEFVAPIPDAKEAVAEVISIVPSSMGGKVRMEMNVLEKTNTVVLKVASLIGSGDARFQVNNLVVNSECSIAIDSKFLSEFLTNLGTGDVIVKVWEHQLIFKSEFGATLVMPQLE